MSFSNLSQQVLLKSLFGWVCSWTRRLGFTLSFHRVCFSDDQMPSGHTQSPLRVFLSITSLMRTKLVLGTEAWRPVVSENLVLQDEFDNDVDALLEEGLSAPKKRRMEEKYGGDSDHPSDGETSVQPMMTKIKTVLKSE